MKCVSIVLITLVAACGDDVMSSPDAATPDAPTTCPPFSATPLPEGRNTLFINTEGVTLTKGACDDSRTNCTSVIADSEAVIPPFQFSLPATRDTAISMIVDHVQRSLAPYSIDVVTTRPSSGDYWMLVMGGNGVTVTGFSVYGVSPGVCDAVNRNRIGLVFDVGARDPRFYANLLLSNFGALLGLAATMQSGDCMCRSSASCDPDDVQLCTYGVDVSTDPTHACGRQTQDEPELLTAALGCR
jgi:hypothetical protein